MARKELTNDTGGFDFRTYLNDNFLELYNFVTAGSIKTLYEGNANTNAFTDAEKIQLATNTNDISTQDTRINNIEEVVDNRQLLKVNNSTALTTQSITEAGVKLSYFDTVTQISGTGINADVPTDSITPSSTGVYNVVFNISAEFAVSEIILIEFYINDSPIANGFVANFEGNGTGKPILLHFSSFLELTADDILTVQATGVSGGGTFDLDIIKAEAFIEQTQY